jgi:predicted nuclease with TOPRIM domain
MTWTPIKIKDFAFLGPEMPTASLEFNPGLNVVCGASETGKSFIVESIDFIFGGKDEPRDIPERVGYDRIRMVIETTQHGIFTLERSVAGGNYRLFQGLIQQNGTYTELPPLKAAHSHNRVDNLSGWLLTQIGLSAKRIRKNQEGVTLSLSFRNLARLIIIQEEEIIKKSSPFLTGQFISKTSEYSTLKLLLTGVDDSALVPTERVPTRENVNSKIELIEQWIADLDGKIEDAGIDREELEEQLQRLEGSIQSRRQELQHLQAQLEQAVSERHQKFLERDQIRARIDEIKDLLSRFRLLEEHYVVDLERLSAIEESGTLFIYQEQAPCPLCGALPEEQHHDKVCDGDIDSIVTAAKAEMEKVKRLLNELRQTMVDLNSESKELSRQHSGVEEHYHAVDAYIREAISLDVGQDRTTFSELIETREAIKRNYDLFEQRDRLLEQKNKLVEEEVPPSEAAPPARTDLSKTVLDGLSQKIQNILQAWNFPTADRVYFDEPSADIVMDGKPRASMGKGFRAITHAAVSIGLMEYCRDHDLPHPGLVVLDSPLLSYYAPEGEEDSLCGTDLKDRFYEYLAVNHRDNQIIIIENEHPSDALLKIISFTNFTRNPQFGRYGFFPFKE